MIIPWPPVLVAVRKHFCKTHHEETTGANDFCESCEEPIGLQEMDTQYYCPECHVKAHTGLRSPLNCPVCKRNLQKPA
jgi:hypothetical protein